MNGGDRVAAVLQAQEVRFLFTLCGGHISPILVGPSAYLVDVRHEVDAVFAADAVFRMTGVPGVATVTAGPGVTNTITFARHGIPVIAVVGNDAGWTQIARERIEVLKDTEPKKEAKPPRCPKPRSRGDLKPARRHLRWSKLANSQNRRIRSPVHPNLSPRSVSDPSRLGICPSELMVSVVARIRI